MLVHTVYFWLKPELTPAQRAEFRAGVETLGAIPSVSHFFCGGGGGGERRPLIKPTSMTILARGRERHPAITFTRFDPLPPSAPELRPPARAASQPAGSWYR